MAGSVSSVRHEADLAGLAHTYQDFERSVLVDLDPGAGPHGRGGVCELAREPPTGRCLVISTSKG